MEFIFRPIDRWPGALKSARKLGKFKVQYSKILNDLDTELRHLRASSIVLQIALTEEDIRLDGRPRAGAAVRHPGIILSFESKHGPLSYPCDTYSHWQDNLRAISLALTALRAVDRYGVTRRAEQYRGWTALPPPAPNGQTLTKQEALRALLNLSGAGTVSPSDKADQQLLFRQAALRHHPDRGGDPEQFKRLQDVKEALGL